MSRVPIRRLLVTILLLWCAAAVTYAALRRAYGERPAYVNVRWGTSIGDVERGRLERRYSLTPGEPRGERSWNYLLTDVSRDNIRAIVRDPAVADTHEIDRLTFRPAAAATRTAYVGRGPAWAGTFLEWLSVAFASLGGLALGVLLLSRIERPLRLQRSVARLAALLTSPHSIVAALRRLLQAVAARVPEASAEAVAAFRMILGAACLWLLGSHVGGQWMATATPASSFQRLVMAAFEPVPLAADWIRPWIIFWALLFIAGAWARLSYVLLTIGVVAWAALYTTNFGGHAVAAPLMTVICLVWSRWGDAWSVDAWARSRRRGEASTAPLVPRRVYGYTMWAPGVVMATSFAAAAVAKLRVSGVAWITNGTVKYHFLSDAHQAPVDWGLRLAQYESVAVAMSFAAIALESVLIVGVFSRRYRYRAMAGVGGLALLLGFALFQGVIWPLWWLMLLSFLPWHRVRPFTMHPSAAAARPLRYTRLQWAQAGVVLAVITQQIAVSAANVEYDPLLSTWDMYATTYSGPEEYESRYPLTYLLVARFADGANHACNLQAREAAELVKAGTTSSLKRVLAKCFASASAVRSVIIEARRRSVDWATWEFGDEETVRVSEPIAVGNQFD